MIETKDVTAPLIKMLNETGGMALRMNSGTICLGKRYVHLHEEGTADILFFPREWSTGPAYPVWIETKTPTGKTKKSRVEAQERFRDKVENLGHLYIIAKTVQEGFDEAMR
jgi:hypothetical protein